MEIIKISRFDSPAGEMLVGSIGDAICLCDWTAGRRRDCIDRRIRRHLHATCEEGRSPVIERAAAQLEEYFAGRRRTFDLEIRMAGTPFQCSVWSELMKIPYGTTISYAELARRIGNPDAVRAVASANAVNALSVIIPCHRVIGSDRQLTGYGGGLEAKRLLLALEGCTPVRPSVVASPKRD